ncbi:hypothetical protein Tco_1115791, partial [Tanacetum coccineum]
SSASALQVLRRLESIFTSVYAADQKLKKTYVKSFSSAWLAIPRKRISDKKTKNEAKNDKTEHGMKEREKGKVKSKPKSTKVKVKVNPKKVNSQSRCKNKEIP